LFLRYATPIAKLRRIPVLGDCLSWISGKIVPRGALVWVQIQHGPAQGLWIRVNPRTGQTVQQGTGEPQVQRALAEHLQQGQTFYDLGSNIGFFSLIAARLVGPSGHVIAFEADPEIAARASENLAYNNFSHAIVEQKAVWSAPGVVKFERAQTSASPDRGLGHIASSSAPSLNTISVEAVSLDQYISSHPLPDFLKCDVEGAEVEVFEGADRLLREKRPVLLVEMHSSENHAQLRSKFRKLSYVCRDLDENHLLALPQ